MINPCNYSCWLAVGNVCHCFCNGTNHGLLKNQDIKVFKDIYPQYRINNKLYYLISFCHALNYRDYIGERVIIKKLNKSQLKIKEAQDLFNKGECVGQRLIYGVFKEVT